jgi:diphthine synthase
VVVADREMVEERADELMPSGPEEDVAFLVIGDPFGATTHTDLMMRARAKGVEVAVVHNASIMNAVGCCGLQLYNFGQAVSICFWRDGDTPAEQWQPDSWYDKVAVNRAAGLHTLLLLDIKVKEPNLEQLARGRKVPPPRPAAPSRPTPH